MSRDEVSELLDSAKAIKARTMLSLAYGCGLRSGEVVRLKVGDIDSGQGIIRIVQSKGRKDRHVMLPDAILELLRQYWCRRSKRYDTGVRPEDRYVFPGRGSYKPLSIRQLNRLFHQAADAAGQTTQAQEGKAEDLSRYRHVSSNFGSRGHLPRPWARVARRQCRSCQPRPDEGDVGNRALLHSGASCRRRASPQRGHVARCEDDACGHVHIAYNSCRNRHCPKCQATAARDWLEAREAELVPVGYFHAVLTLPAPIADIAFHNKRVIYDLLFKASSEAMLTVTADPKHLGAKVGITAVLHTWGSASCRRRASSTMTHHPHVHMIVPGGGISLDGSKWISCASSSLCRSTCSTSV